MTTRNRPGGRRAAALALALALGAAGCDLDLTNPNSPTEEATLTTVDGVVALAVGMQSQYAASVNVFARAPALVTDEWGVQSRALAADIALYNGGQIDNVFNTVSGPYANAYRIIRSANALLEATPNVGLNGGGLERGILALARLHKAMALGTLIQQYQAVPVNADVTGLPPQSREVVLDSVLSLLEAARADVTGADLTGLRQRVLDPGIDLPNTIDAMRARYYLMDGQYAQAIAAAQAVDLTKSSAYTFTGTDVNPLFNYMLELRYTAPLRSWAREAEPGDRRVTFWADTLTTADPTAPAPVFSPRMYGNRNDPFPLYLPDEMLLIRAEAEARLGNLDAARALINQVRTEETGTPATIDPAPGLEPKTAAELPTLEAVLAQIAYERRYELFLQGLRWEDLRRLGQYVGRQPKAAFLPLPSGECTSNPNSGC